MRSHGISFTLEQLKMRLTRRQFEVAELVSNGWENAQIAAHLGISPKTVATLISRIYLRLNLTNRVQLCRWYLAACIPNDAYAVEIADAPAGAWVLPMPRETA